MLLENKYYTLFNQYCLISNKKSVKNSIFVPHNNTKTNAMITDIFMDFDDTIYDTHGNANLALRELFDEFGLSRYFDRFEDFSIPYWKTNEMVWAQYAQGKITRDALIVKRFMDPLSCGKGYSPTVPEVLRISDFFLEACAVKPNLIPGAKELLEQLKPHYRIHMASNGFHEVQYKKMEASGVTPYFDSVILSEDAGVNKPHTAFFDYAMQQTGITDKRQVVMIGDNIDTDILGAHRYGIRQIWFDKKGKQTPDFTPTARVTTLEEIVPTLKEWS